jgi:hypothetical protein
VGFFIKNSPAENLVWQKLPFLKQGGSLFAIPGRHLAPPGSFGSFRIEQWTAAYKPISFRYKRAIHLGYKASL